MKKLKFTVRVAEKNKVQLKIDTDFIRLDSALKYADIAATGGHAKVIIGNGEVKIDGKPCAVRGKKLRRGDSFEYNNTVYEII